MVRRDGAGRSLVGCGPGRGGGARARIRRLLALALAGSLAASLAGPLAGPLAGTHAAAEIPAAAATGGPGPDDGLRATITASLAPTAQAPRTSPPPARRAAETIAAYAAARPVCTLIRDAAAQHGLPPSYFARLIWRESRFDAKAISPKGAQGIAQFMPGTAKLVGLADPWDPAQAIPASAAHLADLRRELGNWGLAAAGYNEGAGRVWRWLRGRARLPAETQAYVQAITGREAGWFRRRGHEVGERPLVAHLDFVDACSALPVIRTRAAYAGTPRQPWGAQLAGNVNRGRAVAQFSRARARFARIIGDRPPQVVPKRGPRGTRSLWSVQVGAASRAEAARLCRSIKAAGGACMVRRN
ncbi:MAG: lytic transglycosylase domain-containing protein [Pseudomonadota bacterium]